MCETWDLESLLHAPIECGCALAYSFTEVATRRSELPSRSTGFTALPSTFAYFVLIGLLGVVLRLLGVVRHRVALLLQFLDRRQQLRDRGADVGQLDDVGVRSLGQLTQLGQIVGLPLRRRQLLRKACQDAARQRDVAGVHGDARGPGEGLDDGQQRVGGEGGRFVGLGVEDLCCRHAAPETSIIFAAWPWRWLNAWPGWPWRRSLPPSCRRRCQRPSFAAPSISWRSPRRSPTATGAFLPVCARRISRSVKTACRSG